MITIAKDFDWEMSHRLTFHEGLCRNIHGHSYRLRVYLKGENTRNGMILDFYELALIINPILAELDHAFLCSKDDDLIISFLTKNNFKMKIMENFSTCENMCSWFSSQIAPKLREYKNIKELGIRVYETKDAFAQDWTVL